MILALNSMKGFDTDVLAILQQTTTTPVSTVSAEHLEPEFALNLLVESEVETEVTNQRDNDYQMEEELSSEIESDLQSPILPNSELIDLLQAASNPDSKGESFEVNCKEELDDVREAKTMPEIESNASFTDNSSFVDPDKESSTTETDVPKLGGLLLIDTTTTSDFLQHPTSSIPPGNSPSNKLQSEVIYSRSSNQAVVIASALSVSLLLFALLILLVYLLKKHRKKLLMWISQWKMERSQSQQVIWYGSSLHYWLNYQEPQILFDISISWHK